MIKRTLKGVKILLDNRTIHAKMNDNSYLAEIDEVIRSVHLTEKIFFENIFSKIFPLIAEIDEYAESINSTRRLIQELEVEVPPGIKKELWEKIKEFEAGGDLNYQVTLPDIEDDVSKRHRLVSADLPLLFQKEYQDNGNVFMHYLTCDKDPKLDHFKKKFLYTGGNRGDHPIYRGKLCETNINNKNKQGNTPLHLAIL